MSFDRFVSAAQQDSQFVSPSNYESIRSGEGNDAQEALKSNIARINRQVTSQNLLPDIDLIDEQRAARRLTNSMAMSIADKSLAESSVRSLRANEKTNATIKVDVEGLQTQRLDEIVKAIHDNMRDGKTVESLIMSVPYGDRRELAVRYEKAYRYSLKDELKSNRHERALEHLEKFDDPKRELSELKDRLARLSTLSADSQERNVIEHSIRDQLRKLSSDQIHQMQEAKGGRPIDKLIQDSALSADSKKAASIYLKKGCDHLDASDIKQLTEIALACESPVVLRSLSGTIRDHKVGEQKRLMMLQEALGGDEPVKCQARAEFLKNNGDTKLQAVLTGTNLRQAQDLVQAGKTDVSTKIEKLSSSWSMNDKGITGVLSEMTPEEHALFKKGMQMKSPPDLNSPERPAYDYYKKVHDALVHATRSSISPTGANKAAQLDAWEDVAAHGHTTLLGRIARSNSTIGIDNEAGLLSAIRTVTPEDWQLMQDPAYKKRVFEALSGTPDKSAYFSWSTRRAGIRELEKIYQEGHTLDQARALAHPALRDVVTGHLNDQGLLYSLSKAKPSEWNELEGPEKQRLESRIALLADGPKEEATRLLEQLKKGETPKQSFASQLRMDELRGVGIDERVKHVWSELTNNPKAFEALKKGQDPVLDKALRDAFKNPGEYDKYVKPLLTSGSLPARTLCETFKGKELFDNLKMVSEAERQEILELSKRCSRPDGAFSKGVLASKFTNLSQEQREVAVGVLSNKDNAPSIADKVRELAIGEKVDHKQVLADFDKLTPDRKKAVLIEYSDKYHRSMIADWSQHAPDQRAKDDVMAAIPVSVQEQYRTHQRQTESQAINTGIYSDFVPIEQSMEATNRLIKYNLAHLSPEKQAELRKAEDDLQKFFRDSKEALRTNRMAKDEFAKEVTDKIMTMAYIVAAPATGGSSLSPLLCATAMSAAARPLIERALRGEELNTEELRASALAGTVDGALSFAGFRHVKSLVKSVCRNAVTESLEQMAGTSLRTELKAELQRNLEKELVAGKTLDANHILETVIPKEIRATAQGRKLANELAENLEKELHKETRAAAERGVKGEVRAVEAARMPRSSAEVAVAGNDQILASNIDRLRKSIPSEHQAAKKAASEMLGVEAQALDQVNALTNQGQLRNACEALKGKAPAEVVKKLESFAVLETPEGARRYVKEQMELVLNDTKNLSEPQKLAIRKQMETDLEGAMKAAKEQMGKAGGKVSQLESLLEPEKAVAYGRKHMTATLDGATEIDRVVRDTLNFEGTPDQLRKGIENIRRRADLMADPNIKTVVERLEKTLSNSASPEIQRLLRVGEHYTKDEMKERIRKNIYGEVLSHGDDAVRTEVFSEPIKDPRKYLEDLKKQPLDYLPAKDRENFRRAVSEVLEEVDSNLTKRAVLRDGAMPSIFGNGRTQTFNSSKEAIQSLPENCQGAASEFFKKSTEKSYGMMVKESGDGSGRKILIFFDPSHKGGDVKAYAQVVSADGKPVGPRLHVLWDNGSSQGAVLSSVKPELADKKTGSEMVRLYDRHRRINDKGKFDESMGQTGFNSVEEMEQFFNQMIGSVR